MRIGQSYVPIQKIKHLFFCAIIADVTAMNDDISLRHIFYAVMQTMSVREVQDFHV